MRAVLRLDLSTCSCCETPPHARNISRPGGRSPGVRQRCQQEAASHDISDRIRGARPTIYLVGRPRKIYVVVRWKEVLPISWRSCMNILPTNPMPEIDCCYRMSGRHLQPRTVQFKSITDPEFKRLILFFSFQVSTMTQSQSGRAKNPEQKESKICLSSPMRHELV